ncbi:MAG: DUF932 domain-containing protein [Ruminiclostridium sp.]|nr:DUF932 domain-containing protein [Ruminiclostridium sp.]
MKEGRTLQQLAVEIKRQQAVAKDFLADTGALTMETDSSTTRLTIGNGGDFGITDIAHGQIGEYLQIPGKYYEKMRSESPKLLATNVNHWLHQVPQTEAPVQKMVRTLDGNVRAFLSNRYRRIDNVQVAETVLPIISTMQGAEVKSCELTERKMYLKVVNPRLTTEIRKGDVVQAGIVISNSEVGMGSVSVSPLIYRMVCSNGMIAQDGNVRKYHIGRVNEADYDMGIFRDDTIAADDAAFMMKVRDAVYAAVEQAIFEQIVSKMREATEAKIDNGAMVPKVIELTSKDYSITQSESEGVLGHLIEGGDLTLYGVSNAITRYAQDVKSYDRSTELEAIGFKVLTMPKKRWFQNLAIARKENV